MNLMPSLFTLPYMNTISLSLQRRPIQHMLRIENWTAQERAISLGQKDARREGESEEQHFNRWDNGFVLVSTPPKAETGAERAVEIRDVLRVDTSRSRDILVECLLFLLLEKREYKNSVFTV